MQKVKIHTQRQPVQRQIFELEEQNKVRFKEFLIINYDKIKYNEKKTHVNKSSTS